MSSAGPALDRARDLALKPHGWALPTSKQGLSILQPLGSTQGPATGRRLSVGAPQEMSWPHYNTQQTYCKVREWFVSWQPWQQKLLLNGITNRCSTIQLESLATSLEPVFHRDFVASLKKRYPSAPFQKAKHKQKAKSNVTFIQPELEDLSLKNLDSMPYGQNVGSGNEETHINLRSKENQMEMEKNCGFGEYLEHFAHDFAEKVISQAIDTYQKFTMDAKVNMLRSEMQDSKNIENVDVKKLTSVEAQPVGRPRSSDKVTTEERLLMPAQSEEDIRPASRPLHVIGEEPQPSAMPHDRQVEEQKHQGCQVEATNDELDTSQFRVRTSSFIKMRKEQLTEMELKLKQKMKQIVSMPLLYHHLSISKRIHMLEWALEEDSTYLHRQFSAVRIPQQIRTQDFFDDHRSDQLGPMQAQLRTGRVRKPPALNDIYVPLQRMYKHKQWWSGSASQARSLTRPNKGQLSLQYKKQLQQIWVWMSMWKDYEKLSLLSELIKLCDTELLRYFTQCLGQRLQEKLDINWLSDKLLLLLFSYLSLDDIGTCSRVCRRWRYLCAIDDLWRLKCHEFGLDQGIPDIIQMVKASNQDNQIIDWKLAYLEIQRITHDARVTLPIPIRLEFEGTTPEGMKRVGGKFMPLMEEGMLGAWRRTPGGSVQKSSQRSSQSSKIEEANSQSSTTLLQLASQNLRDGSLASGHDGQMMKRSQVGGVADGDRGSDGEKAKELDGTTSANEQTAQIVATSRSDLMLVGVRKKKGDSEGEIAQDIRPQLKQAKDLVGRISPPLDPAWQSETAAEARMKLDQFAGYVKSVKRVRKLQGHMDAVLCVEFDHRRLISGSLDRTIRVWDIRSGRSIHKMYSHKGGVSCLQFDNETLFSGSWDMTIMVWDLVSFNRKAVLTGHRGSITGLRMHENVVLSSSHDGTVKVWSKLAMMCLHTLQIHTSPILSMEFDGYNIITCASDKTLKLTSFKTNETRRHFKGPELADRILCQGHLMISGNKKGLVQFWNRETGAIEAAIQAHDAAINTIAYLNGHFYTASSDASIKEWDLLTMCCVRHLQGHKGPVNDLKVSDSRIVSCSTDGHIRVWDMEMPAMKLAQDDDNIQLDFIDQRHLGKSNI